MPSGLVAELSSRDADMENLKWTAISYLSRYGDRSRGVVFGAASPLRFVRL